MKGNTKYLILILSFLIKLSFVYADDNFVKYTIHNGLTNNSVKVVFEDSEGFFWVGTESGVSKYTGRRFIPLEPYNSKHLERAFVKDINEDGEGKLYIATIGRGLLIYNIYENTLEQVREVNGLTFSDIGVLINSNDTIYAVSFNGFVATFYKGEMIEMYKLEKFRGNQIFSFYWNKVPTIVTDRNHFYTLQNGKFVLSKIAELGFPIRNIKNFGENNTIISDPGGAVYMLNLSDFSIKTLGGFKNTPVKAISANYAENEIFVSFRGKGLYKYEKGTFINQNAPSRYIEEIFFDKNNSIWLCTWEGLFKEQELSKLFNQIRFQESYTKQNLTVLNPSEGLFYMEPDEILNYNIGKREFEGFKVDGIDLDYVYLIEGGNQDYCYSERRNGRINIYNNKLELKRVIVPDTLLNSSRFQGIKKNGDDLLIRSEFFYYRFSLRDNKFYSFFKENNREISIIYKYGKYWLSKGEDCVYEIDNGKVFKHEFNDSTLRIIALSGSQNLLFAFSDEKVFLYSKEKNCFKQLPEPRESRTGKEIYFDRVVEVREDNYGGYWISSDGPLVYWDIEKNKVVEFDIRNSDISSIDFSSDYYIFPANSGLYVLDRKSMERFIDRPEMYLYKFTKENGLPEDIFFGSLYELYGNLRLITGKDGPVVFDKEEFIDYIKSITNNKIFISKITANNELFEMDSSSWYKNTFELPKRTTDILVELATQNTPLNNYYRYRLLGFNKKWIDAGTRNQIIYNSLKPGKYTLEIVSNLSENKKIKIIIPPTWYQTSLFKALVLILVLILGFGVVKLREKRLETQNKYLEEKIYERTKELQFKNNEIIDNMKYARRIQRAMMPSESVGSNLVNDYFVFIKPRDIVSGDFFYLRDFGHKLVFAVADCTGHGVSGAFMSILSHTILHQELIKDIDQDPSEMLNEIRERIKSLLHQEGKDDDTKDGMDIGLAIYDSNTKIVKFSGAFIPLYIVKDKTLNEIKADRQPVAYYINEMSFTTKEVKVEKGDVLYLSSDGYHDQIGGRKNKRLYSRRFKKILVDISDRKLANQKDFLEQHLKDWRGDNEQVDDICVMGLRV